MLDEHQSMACFCWRLGLATTPRRGSQLPSSSLARRLAARQFLRCAVQFLLPPELPFFFSDFPPFLRVHVQDFEILFLGHQVKTNFAPSTQPVYAVSVISYVIVLARMI